MSVARPTDGLLSASSTVALIELLAVRPEGADIEQTIRDLAALTPISWSRARNTIQMLISYNLLHRTGQMAVDVATKNETDWYEQIAKLVAQDFATRLTNTGAWSCLKLDPGAGMMMIDAMTLPPMRDGLSMWVTDFGVAYRPKIQARFWTVAHEHYELFMAHAREANVNAIRHSKTAEQLATDLARQAELGKETEEWVVGFEKRRLCEHPLSDQIRRISDDDVSAGYDILSFATQESIQHDLFIEVKSYAHTKLFHWSRNEIAAAREFGETYALYLVDRRRCSEEAFIPHIIKGPTPEMFTLPGSGWQVEPTSFEHVAIQSL